MLSVESLGVAAGGRRLLDDVSLTLAPGRTLAVLGESGAGKTTLLRAILGLMPAAAGRVLWQGADIAALPRWPVGRAALVMQDPLAALSPHMTLAQSVAEPLRAQRRPAPEAVIAALFAALELDPGLMHRRPRQVSLGQAQRACLARALIAAPPLVLFDEPLSALDAATQKHTARLIARVQAERGFAALIVTHDLGYAAAHADVVAVLAGGRVVEAGPTAAVLARPVAPETRALVDSAVALGAIERARAA